MRLSARLLLTALVPATLLSLGAIVAGERLHRAHLTAHIEESLRYALDLQARNLEEHFAARVSVLEALAAAPPLREGEREDALRYLRLEQARQRGRFEALYYNDLAGMAWPAFGEPFSVQDRYYFPQAQRGEVVITRVLVSKDTGRPVVLVLVPVLGADGARRGALGGTIRVEDLVEALGQRQIPRVGTLLLADEGGAVLSAQRPLSSGEELRLAEGLRQRERDPWRLTVGGEGYLVHHASVGQGLGWKVALLSPEEELLLPLRAGRALAVVLVLLSLGVALAVMALTNRIITQPLARLVGTMRRYGQGEAALRADVERRDEAGALAAAFNEMADQVQRQSEARERASLALSQAQRVESIALLAGGVAHDFNNLLTTILGNVELARLDEGRSDRSLEEIEGAAQRGARLVQRLLSMGRRQPVEPRVIDPGAVLRDLLPLLRRLMARKGTLEAEYKVGELRVRIDPVELEQVLLNLVANARDAIEPRGRVKVRLAGEDRGGRRRAILAVEDDGQGIPEETLEKLFDPFFTTKPPGQGTGLGLPTCREIVARNGGTIEVESRVGEGSRFTVALPDVS